MLVRERAGQRVTIEPRLGETAGEVEADFQRSFDLAEELRSGGTEEWRSHFRRVGPIKMVAYKEVGPPAWRLPRVTVTTKGDPATIRFLIGWRLTAYGLTFMWAGRG